MFIRLPSSSTSLAESLALPLPTLPPLASTSIITGTGTSNLNTSQSEDTSIGGPGSPWNDEEEKRFYTDLPDLRGEVPGALLKQNDGPAGDASGADSTTDDMHIDRDHPNDLEAAENLDDNR